VIINATNISGSLTGIARYSLALSRYLLQHWEYPFTLYVNALGKPHLGELADSMQVRTTSPALSPDHRFRGHLARMAWTSTLPARHRGSWIFNTSQLEVCPARRQQIVTVHDVIPLMFPQHNLKQHFYFKYALPKVLRRCAAIITVSEASKTMLQEHYALPASKIHVIHNGVAQTFFEPIERQETTTPYVLYVGRPTPAKNLRGLFRGFERLRNEHGHNVRLKMAIGSQTPRRLPSDSLMQHIDLLPPQDDAQLAQLYANAEALLLPSHYEGFGLPPLEAMACGCPAVVSNLSSLPEVCGDAAIYVTPTDPGSIADGIHKILSDSQLRTELIEKGRQHAEQFTWERSAQKHIEVLEQTMMGM